MMMDDGGYDVVEESPRCLGTTMIALFVVANICPG